MVALQSGQIPAGAKPGMLECFAWGGSHTGRYTFTVDTEPCSIYWHEIERHLKILECAPPRLMAQKPFAPASGYVLMFDLETGLFEDSVPGWVDRGKCSPKKTESSP